MTIFIDQFLNIEYRPLMAVLIPFASACIIMVLGDIIKLCARGVLNFIAASAEVCLIISMMPAVIKGGELLPESYAGIGSLPVTFDIDPAGMVFACASSVVWLLASVYLTGCMHIHKEEDLAIYNAAFALCMASVMGMCFAADLRTMVIFFVIIIAASCPVIVFRKSVKRRELVFYIISITGTALAAAASLRIDAAADSAVLAAGGFITSEMISESEALILFLMMSGAGLAAAGILSAPSPSRALIYAVTAGIAGVFFILRTVIYVFGPEVTKACQGTHILKFIAIAAVLAAFAAAARSRSASNKISLLSVMMLSAAVAGNCSLTPFSTAGSIYHIAALQAIIALLLMSGGAVFSDSIGISSSALRAEGRPFITGVFAAVTAAAAGLPPFADMTGTANIIYGAVFAGDPVSAVVLPVTGVLAAAVLMPVVIRFCRNSRQEGEDPASLNKINAVMLVPMVMMAAFMLFLGILPNAGLHLFELSLEAGNSAFMPLM